MARSEGRRRTTRSRRKFEYKPRSKEQIEKRANQKGGAYDSVYKDQYKVWKPKEGSHCVRVLPPTWKNPDHYGLEIWLHSSVGPENQSYLALDKMLGQPDPIAEAIADAQRRGEGEAAWVKELRPYKRVLTWVIVRGEEKEGPQLWPMPWTLDRDFTKHQVDKKTGELLHVDDPEDGYDFEFEREGNKFPNIKYVAPAVARRSSPLSDDPDQADEWLQFVVDNPLPDTLVYYDYDYITKVFNAAGSPGSDVEDEEDEDEEPVRTRRQRLKEEPEEEDLDEEDEDEEPVRTRRRSKVKEPEDDIPFDEGDEDEDLEDEEEEDEEDEEEEEPPRRSKTKSKSRRALKDEEIDDEDEDLDEEDEEEEEPPRRSRGRSSGTRGKGTRGRRR